MPHCLHCGSVARHRAIVGSVVTVIGPPSACRFGDQGVKTVFVLLFSRLLLPLSRQKRYIEGLG